MSHLGHRRMHSRVKAGCACSICGMEIVCFIFCGGVGGEEGAVFLFSTIFELFDLSIPFFLFFSLSFFLFLGDGFILNGNSQSAVKFKTTNRPAVQGNSL